jgi:hypothetical protein
MTNQETLTAFYSKLIKETAEGTQRKVCEACGIPLNPLSGADLRPIPVYEEKAALCLLGVANGRSKSQPPTEIMWATSGPNEYLPAYFKRYKRPDDGRSYNQIVVTTNNYCIARFFAAKELMHCFMDDDGYPSTNSVRLVHDLIDALVAGGTLLQRQDPQTIVDEMAWMGAVLYLIPAGWIPLLKKMVLAIQTQEPTANGHLFVAQLIRVPEKVLRLRLKSDPPSA